MDDAARGGASMARGLGQAGLGALMLTAGTAHFTTARRGFQVAVPHWFPADPDRVVLVSGAAELALGAALVATWRQPARAWVGLTTAVFLVAVFPGNVSQYLERRDAPGLDTDARRLLRLPLQVPLVGWALAAGDVRRTLGPAILRRLRAAPGRGL